jgi:enoyl-CoA hydratase
MQTAYETLIIDRDTHLCVIRMNRPHALNACNTGLWRDLVDVFTELGKDDAVRAVILTGEGRAFCVGADLKETAWHGETSAQSRARIERHQQRLARLILGLPVPTVAAINGYALGGGLEIALACDIRIAAEGARMGFPEAAVGSFITGGASLLLPRLIGLSAAKRLFFSATHVEAPDALKIGLVDAVTAPHELLSEARAMCAKITENAPLSVRAGKSVFNRLTLGEIETALELETLTLMSLYGTEDHREGSRAFAQKRKPDFHGR